ncbi:MULTISPECIES: hypothetical protein [unclassified Pseudomonas]|uniref:hypothetical protein n=1 Tax=unclassified Pseudomonas TaxID=196821 RepID=UPI00114708CC|nr:MULTISPECIES: hypothetical protein [unclassified Pseudomonas]QOF82281.1 hypothetical protein IG194_16915 [Pseudomonas sp. ADPe]
MELIFSSWVGLFLVLGLLLAVLISVISAGCRAVWNYQDSKHEVGERFLIYLWHCRQSPETFDPGYAATLVWSIRCRRCRHRYMPLARMLNRARLEKTEFGRFREEAVKAGFQI